MSKKIKENKPKSEYEVISLFRNPIETIKYLIVILSEQLIRFLRFLVTHKIIMILGVSYLIMNFLGGPHREVSRFLN